MRGLRLGVAMTIVAVLAALIWWALSRPSDPEPEAAPPSTVSTTSTTTATTTTTLLTTSTTTVPASSTTSAEQRVAEVEAILEELWFGWFDAIYRKDPDALWQVVATSAKHGEGVEAMEVAEFARAPAPEDVDVEVIEILLDRSDCLVVYDRLAVSGFAEGESPGVEVLWPDGRFGWRIATAWVGPGDLWLSDCDDLEREQSP